MINWHKKHTHTQRVKTRSSSLSLIQWLSSLKEVCASCLSAAKKSQEKRGNSPCSSPYIHQSNGIKIILNIACAPLMHIVYSSCKVNSDVISPHSGPTCPYTLHRHNTLWLATLLQVAKCSRNKVTESADLLKLVDVKFNLLLVSLLSK